MRQAEILYTLGNSGNLEHLYNARKYFSHALVLKDGVPSARALWGLLKTCKLVETHLKKTDSKNK